ncbi:MAG: isopropylmalate isomerase large subunit, 3-isopropylmalate/(R)-2-methylmalate dehydratase large subunit [Candidatus Gottesmanbacteria bacterium GW2011_GWA2_43_14]|uniref:3-isopropylmalate dehydratase large subunit n=1 Tax=Candidatus Gottesmanbacteria bacterium GW2011_GWA2_43_14 TaxID=1618443 RepID=A0A0G1GAZ7_9BACT|nr:MAG: isopropylmalate isomerase large subunit, 3-isopropylmalate/(R)-2-methylmalate dehydratase large subunit [Candidatus Gottesmanbacteria bacterium GW2011_GWA2_43_14]
MTKKTLAEKIWEKHIVHREKNGPSILYIDGHILHEVTTPQAFANLRLKGLRVRRTDKTIATCDHNVPTDNQTVIADPLSKLQVETLIKNCRDFGIRLYGLDSAYQGIVHVMAPELGFVQPGQTIVCGDSHTSTHGAFGALAFGIGTTEIEQVLATQCILAKLMQSMEIAVEGDIGKGVTAKDIILTILAGIGTGGGAGFFIEYTGSLIRNLTMEQRMTICNMSIEAGSRAGLIAPDEITFSYLKGKKFVPNGQKFDEKVRQWKKLKTDKGAKFAKSLKFEANKITPLVTWGTDPASAIKINGEIPDPKNEKSESRRKSMEKALSYMNLKPSGKLEGFPIDYIFIGSCTNARISDLREAAAIIKGKKVSPEVTALVVPGSRQVKLAAEREGLDRIFTDAGFQWRWSGCSACIAMNSDRIPAGKYCVSTSNRNYEGRQGPGARTFLASPLTAAVSALEGRIADPRNYL